MKSSIWFLLLAFLTEGCLDLSGGINTLVKESPNKSRTKKVVLFFRQSGATVGDSYQVSICDYEDKFDTTAVGNAFTMDANHGEGFLSPENVNFTWIADDSLHIDYDEKLRTFIMYSKVEDVGISYKPTKLSSK